MGGARGLISALALLWVGCAVPPATLPVAHGNLQAPRSTALGATAVATRVTHRAGAARAEPKTCAKSDEATGFQPATDDACTFDGQGWFLRRTKWFSIGGIAYGGQTSIVALGGLFAVHPIRAEHHALTLTAGAGLPWAMLELSYAWLPAQDYWLFIGAGGGLPKVIRGGAGFGLRLSELVSMTLEGGYAYRWQDQGLETDHRYSAVHLGLGLVLTP